MNGHWLPTGQLVVPRTRTVYGSRSFAVHGPVVWNSLPAELRLPDMTLGVFLENSWRHTCLTASSAFAELLNLRYKNVINNNNNNKLACDIGKYLTVIRGSIPLCGGSSAVSGWRFV